MLRCAYKNSISLSLMSTSRVYIIFYTLLLLSWNCNASDQTTSSNKHVTNISNIDAKKLVKNWVSLWNTYDLSMLDSIFLNDSRLTYFSSEKEGLIKGIEAVRKHHIGFGFVTGGKKQSNKLWLDDLHSQSFGKMVTVNGIWYFRKESGNSPNNLKRTGDFCLCSGEK